LTESSTVRPPLQARSRKTLARIVDAGVALLAEGGPASVTVQAVVARARVSVGSFYARFKGRRDLLEHVLAEAGRREHSRWEAELEPIGDEGTLEQSVRAVIDLLLATPADASRAAHAELHHAAARVLLERRPEIRHPEPEAAIELGYAAVSGAVRLRPEGWTDERLKDELTRLWLAYLGRPNAGRGDDRQGGVDFFEVWA
jgi:AcrR family transcriptional regulator